MLFSKIAKQADPVPVILANLQPLSFLINVNIFKIILFSNNQFNNIFYIKLYQIMHAKLRMDQLIPIYSPRTTLKIIT